jgi:hypothetical protein
MAWTLCTSGSAIAKAGLNANSTLTAYGGTNKTILDTWSDEVEREIEAQTGLSIVDNFLTYALSGSASAAASSKIAMLIIGYDTTGYLSREADSILNVNDQIYKDNIKNMRDLKKTNLVNPNS